jgi:hypothetical protein
MTYDSPSVESDNDEMEKKSNFKKLNKEHD